MRIKTLEQLSDQRENIVSYLTKQRRYKAAGIVDDIFNNVFDRILGIIGITTIDDETIEIAMNEPVFVSEYQRLP